MSDLQRRSEALLRQRGFLTASVERRKRFPERGKPACKDCGSLPMIDIAVDLWNVFDLIAARPQTDRGMVHDSMGFIEAHRSPDIIFVQVTDSTNHSHRRNKIIASSEARLCLLSGARILIQSWEKVDNRYRSRDEWIALDQFCVGLADTVEQFYEDEKRKKLLERGLPPSKTLPLSPYLKDSEMEF